MYFRESKGVSISEVHSGTNPSHRQRKGVYPLLGFLASWLHSFAPRTTAARFGHLLECQRTQRAWERAELLEPFGLHSGVTWEAIASFTPLSHSPLDSKRTAGGFSVTNYRRPHSLLQSPSELAGRVLWLLH